MNTRRSPLIKSACALVALVCVMTMLARAAERSPKNPTAQKKKTSAANTDVTLDLRDFGAVGDGETDDGPALQGALDALAAAGGGTLFVPAGARLLVVPSAFTLSAITNSVRTRGPLGFFVGATKIRQQRPPPQMPARRAPHTN